jgi:archaemetzincin
MEYFYVGAAPEVSAEDHRMVRDRLAAEFGLPVRMVEIPAVDFAYDANRRQYGSAAVLEMLLRLCPGEAAKMLAVIDRDLFVPVLTFVYGLAQLGGRVAVLSLARLRQEFYGLPPNHELLVERAAKEALHESGHLFGLVHCADRNCAMSLATDIVRIDDRQGAFCATCRGRLLKAKG